MLEVRKIKPNFVDSRGEITNILDESIESVVLITSEQGAIRANHYHINESHYTYIISGSMEYYQKKIDSEEVEKTIVRTGEMVFSPAKHAHAMKFLEPSVFLALTTRKRLKGRYDEDTVRYKLI